MIAFTTLALLFLGAAAPSLAGEPQAVEAPLPRSVVPHTLAPQAELAERGFFRTKMATKGRHGKEKHRHHGHNGTVAAKHHHHHNGTKLHPVNGDVSVKGAKAHQHNVKEGKKGKKGKKAKAKKVVKKGKKKHTTKKNATATPDAVKAVSAGKNKTSTSFAKAALKRHNLYRKQYGAKPLTWSPTLAAAAQKWASQCKWAHSGGSVGAYGENIAAGQTTIEGVVDAWVNGPNESSSYDPKNPTASHFTQVVWKSTKQLGCAKATCPGIAGLPQANPIFWVCEYAAPGNVFPASNFLTNVGTKK